MRISAEQRAALERRVWRLAFLLSGDGAGAAALVDRVLRARGDAATLEPARLDRLIIQHARSLTARVPMDEGDLAQVALRAARSLSEQPREAWVLSRVDGVDELWMGRAMDCSRTAARMHLATADDFMRSRLGARHDEAVEALRRFADGLDPGPIIAAHRVMARKRKNRRLVAGTLVALLGGLAVLMAALKLGAL